MIKAFEEIVAAVFPGEDSELYLRRLNLIYRGAWEQASASEHTKFKKEMLECEYHFAENTRLEKIAYKQPTTELLLAMYSGIAYALAKRRLETEEKSLCAKYLGDALEQLLESKNIFNQLDQNYKMLVSEAFVDFAYAEGNTEMMSFRLRHSADGNA